MAREHHSQIQASAEPALIPPDGACQLHMTNVMISYFEIA